MSGALGQDWNGRLEAVRAAVSEQACDVCVISSLDNIRYLTGMDASAGLLVLTSGTTFLLLDGRYTTVAREFQEASRLGHVVIVPVDQGFDAALQAVLVQTAARRVMFEGEHTTVATLTRWQRVYPADWHAPGPVVEGFRVRTDIWSFIANQKPGCLLIL